MVALSPARFNQMLNQMGQRVQWRKAFRCPCRDPVSGAPRQGHALCRGKGWLWDPPISAITGIAGQNVKRRWAAFGMFEDGEEILTIPSNSPLWACGETDRIVMVESSEPFSAVVMRGVDTLLFQPVTLDRVFWLDSNGAPVDGDLPTADNGVISWHDGDNAPPLAQQYSITGRKYPEFYVFGDLPRDRAHYRGQALPRLVRARRFDLFGR